MIVKGFDTETYPILQRGKATQLSVPRVVCLSTETEVMDARDGVEWFKAQLEDPQVHLVAHNTAFDVLALCDYAASEMGEDLTELVFGAYDARRIHDTMIREKLDYIARGYDGPLGLGPLVKRYFNRKIEHKGSSMRLRYNELEGIPVSEWPQMAIDYAVGDAFWARKLFDRQKHGHQNLQGEPFQCYAAFCMALASAWGMMVDHDVAYAIDGHYARIEEQLTRELEREEIMVDGTMKRAKREEIFEAAWASVGRPPELTAKGNIATSKLVTKELEELGVEEPRFALMQQYDRACKFRSTYLEPILDADPRHPLCPGYWVLVNSGRTSSRGPNIQNFPSLRTKEQSEMVEAYEGSFTDRVVRDGLVTPPDIRGCFIPRPGKAFVTADYTALEMSSLAQVCKNLAGELTPLGLAINAGRDLHLMVVAAMKHMDYDDVVALYKSGDIEVARLRRIAKIANFSFPTGATADTFRVMARNQGVKITREEAEFARASWFRAWTEMDMYQRHIMRSQDNRGSFWVYQHGPKGRTSGWRNRRCDKMTEAANSYFQGMAGDGAKTAMIRITKACYLDDESPLYGARMPLFVHDEFGIEIEKERAQEAAEELSALMISGMQVFMPDIEIRVTADILEERWEK